MKDAIVLLALLTLTASGGFGQARPIAPRPALDPGLALDFEVGMAPFGSFMLADPVWRQAGPEDSLYRAARETLNRGEYRRAAELFGAFGERYPDSRYRSAAGYWQAFALYRAGGEADLRTSLSLLDNLTKGPSRDTEAAEVRALLTRVVAALAARGDATAAGRLRQGAGEGPASCDSEDLSVRAEALAALYQNDPAGTMPVLRRILDRRDECSIPLRRRAVYLIGKDGDASNAPVSTPDRPGD